ncbi:MAG TPA: protein-glutamate O-methyltransferase CheR [Vicinamibacteria bacterium]
MSLAAGSPVGLPEPSRSLSSLDFRRFQSLIHRESGIHLTEAKRLLVEGRLARRLRELDLDFQHYYRLVETDERERMHLLDCIATNETHFFREPRQFDFLRETAFPEFYQEASSGRRPRRFRVWSAGCSTGEEPYSVAMAFQDFFPPGSGFEIEITATDLSTRVLSRARSAVWPIEKAGELPEPYLRKFMLRGTGTSEGWIKASRELRTVVHFERLNLHGDALPEGGPFDLVFCRNVLIYFDPAGKLRVLARLLERLLPSGYLFLGHTETLLGQGALTRSVGPTVYAHSRRVPS